MRLPNGLIYLDYNATTPIDPRVIERMQVFLETEFGNASSTHVLGQRAAEAIHTAREKVAKSLGCSAAEIVFTSGGSESNNLAIKGFCSQYAHQGRHLIVSAIEHPSVLVPVHWMEKQGFRVSYLPVDKQGVIQVSELQDMITSKTVLVSIMHANNEVGSVQPIAELVDLVHEMGALLHVDAAQTFGKIPVNVGDLKCDLLTIAGHKVYGPKGIGALFIRSGVKLEPLIQGGSQQQGRRAGTENVSGAVGLGEAAELAMEDLESEHAKLKTLRDKLQEKLKDELPFMRINASAVKRIPNTLSISFREIKALELMNGVPDVLMSAGAACHTGDAKGSDVLGAMGVPLEYQMGTVRLSLGRFSDATQVDEVADKLSTFIKKRLMC